MAYMFIDDGYPEARDYEGNYQYFDENEPKSLEQLLKVAKQLIRDRLRA